MQCHRCIEAGRPGIVIVEKMNKGTKVIVVAVPEDCRVHERLIVSKVEKGILNALEDDESVYNSGGDRGFGNM